MKIATQNFGGIVPVVSPRTLPKNAAQIAENCDLAAGSLRPLRVPILSEALSITSPQTIFKYNGRFLAWAGDVDVVRNTIENEAYDRIYYTDGVKPKVRGRTGATESEYDLAVPAPVVAPTVVAVAKTSVTWTRIWKYQYEKADKSIMQQGTIVEGSAATEMAVQIVGKKWYLYDAPVRTFSEDSNDRTTFVLKMEAYDEYGILMGTVYPDISNFAAQNAQPYLPPGSSDLYISGAYVSASQINTNDPVPLVSFKLKFDTSRVSDYKIERTYVMTNVTAWGEESGPSPASEIVAVDPAQNCNLTALEVYSGSRNITLKRLYRSVIDSDGVSYFQFVIELPVATTSYLDSIADADTGETLATELWGVPYDDMHGIKMMAGGFWVAFRGKDVVFGEPYYPHVCRRDLSLTMDYDVVGIGISGNSAIVLTRGGVEILTGDHPESIGQSKGTLLQPCISKRSIVQWQDQVAYACADGLVVYQGNVGKVVTEGIFDKDDWTELLPTTLMGAVYDAKYFAWNASGATIFDFTGGALTVTTTTELASAAYTDLETDTLTIAQSASAYTWEGGTVNMTARWRGKLWQTPEKWCPVACRVVADSYASAITMNFYANGILVLAQVLTTDVARKIPTLRREKEWEFEVVSRIEIHEMLATTSMAEL